MSKEQMMQEFVSSAITPLLERVVVKKLIQSFEVIAEKQKADLTAAKARIAELERVTEEATSILCGHNFKGNSPLELMARKAMGRIAELEEALEPFAREYYDLASLSPSEEKFFGRQDLRRAAELLKDNKP